MARDYRRRPSQHLGAGAGLLETQRAIRQADERHLPVFILSEGHGTGRKAQCLDGSDLGAGEQREHLQDEERQHAEDGEDDRDAAAADQTPHPTVYRQGQRTHLEARGLAG